MKAKSIDWDTLTKNNVRHLAYWTSGWVLTLAIAAFGPKFLWDNNSNISLLFILINTIIGVGMILLNRKYINGLDEMHRKINWDAMAFALGVGVVGGLSYSLLDIADVITFDAEIAHLVILISMSYLAGYYVGSIRYK